MVVEGLSDPLLYDWRHPTAWSELHHDDLAAYLEAKAERAGKVPFLAPGAGRPELAEAEAGQ